MANDIFNYCVATNTGKGFITHDDSRRFWISGQPANVWVCTDCAESRHWVARNNGVSKTKAEAQTLVNTEVTNNQNAWDALSDEAKAQTSGRPGDVTLP